MWTVEQRQAHARVGLRYPSDLTDAEWALAEPLIPPARRGGRKRMVDTRAVLDGIFYVLATGCQWRALPKDLPPRSTVRERPAGPVWRSPRAGGYALWMLTHIVGHGVGA
jgi:transposase